MRLKEKTLLANFFSWVRKLRLLWIGMSIFFIFSWLDNLSDQQFIHRSRYNKLLVEKMKETGCIRDKKTYELPSDREHLFIAVAHGFTKNGVLHESNLLMKKEECREAIYRTIKSTSGSLFIIFFNEQGNVDFYIFKSEI